MRTGSKDPGDARLAMGGAAQKTTMWLLQLRSGSSDLCRAEKHKTRAGWIF